MKSALTVVLFRLFTIGVFVDGKEESNVLVMEGDSVTLKPGVTDVQKKYTFEWRFNVIRIDTFGDGLQLNNQTGDLKISNIRTKDSGQYKVKISSPTGSPPAMEFTVKVESADEVKSVSVMVGDSVTLRTDDPDIQRVDVIRWRFGQQKSLVAEINRMDEIFNKLDGPDERFRDRLKLDNQTGSLTITNTRTTDAGLYEAEISSTRRRYTIHYTQSFSVTGKDEVESVSVLMGDNVTLRTGLTGIQRDDEILWKFGDNDETIAPLKTWRNIDLNSMTGDLTISNIQRDQSGHYKVEIITRRMILHRKYRITIGEMKTVSVKEGESVTLHINVTKIQSDDLIVWMFGNINLAEFNKTGKLFTTSDVPDRRFRLRLDLDHQNGSLIITDTRTTDSGDYQLKIISSRHIINRRITVTVSGVFGEKMSVSVKEGDSVTLFPELSEIKKDDVIDWRFRDSLIARVRNNNNPSVYEDALDGTFRGRLKLNGQTGDLTITNFRNTDAGDYEVSNSINTFKKTFSVSDAGPSPGVVAGIVVAVGLLAAAGVVGVVVYYRRKISERQRVENGGNRNTQKTDDHATEETKLDDS